MTTDDNIRDKKLHYNIKREAAKTSPLSSSKIYKYEYLTAKIDTYSRLGKALEKQLKAIKDHREN